MSCFVPSLRRAALTLLTFAAAALLGAGALAAPASAEIRSGVASDPVDVPTDINGVPSSADIESVRASYDTAGTLTLIATFFQPVGRYNVSWGVAGSNCSVSTEAGGGAFASADPSSGTGTLSVTGFSGFVPATVSVSADRRAVMLEATHPVLANRAFGCIYSTSSSFTGSRHYDSGCSCFTTVYDMDAAPALQLSSSTPIEKVIAPPPAPATPDVGGDTPDPAPTTKPKPACGDGVDNDGDGTIDMGDWGCATKADASEVLTNVPTLSLAVAGEYARDALRAKYKAIWKSGTKRKVACSRRTASRVACRVSWVRRTKSYRGTVTVARTRQGERVLKTTLIRVKARRR